jgi:23S rRNA (uracil1939-C5)-methyltransferase
VTTEARDLFRRPLLAEELARFDAVLLDPPRAGAEAQVAEIARARLPTVAMISCNPVSFARDARALARAGYRLDWVQVVDQFRWSPHVELAARFSL